MFAAGLVLLVVALVGATRRFNELFRLSVREGHVLLVRGRIPAGLLGEIRDVVKSPRVRRATLRAERDAGGARLTIAGEVAEGQAQRLRNVFGLYPVSKLHSAPGISQPTLGQWLGIAWLAWWFERRQ